ncbi:MAG: hypothetical protein VW378_02100 [bacterium]
MIAIDEGWNAVHAYDQWGKNPFPLHSTLISQIFPLYYILLAFSFLFFDISLFTVRSIAILIGLVGFNGFFFLLSRFISSKRLLSIGMILFLFHNVFIVTFRWGRLEFLVTTLMIWSVYFLVKAIQSKHYYHLFFTGLLVGLMVFTHPFATAFVLSILLVLWRFPINTRKSYLYFVGGGGIVLFLMVLKGFTWDLIFIQNHFFSIMFERTSFHKATPSLFYQFYDFFRAYCLGLKRVYILFFEIGIIIFSFFRYRKDPLLSNLSLISFFTFIQFLLILHPFRARYMGIVIVISILLAVVGLLKEKVLLKKFLFVFVFLYFSNNLMGDLYFLYIHKNNTPYSIITKELTTEIPLGSKIVAPVQFWLALHEYYTITEIHDAISINQQKPSLSVYLNNSDYFIYSPYFLVNISPTSGTIPVRVDLSQDHFNLGLKKATQNPQWTLHKTIDAIPYDKIFIYKRVVPISDPRSSKGAK